MAKFTRRHFTLTGVQCDVDLEEEDIAEILEEFAGSTSPEMASAWLDDLDRKGLIVPLIPATRSEVLSGKRALSSVLL